MSEESMWRAVHRIESAAERIGRAGEQAEQAAQRIANLLENGYGGNGLRLIELLEDAKVDQTPSVVPDDAMVERFLAALEGECEGLGIPADIARSVLTYTLAAAPGVPRG